MSMEEDDAHAQGEKLRSLRLCSILAIVHHFANKPYTRSGDNSGRSRMH